MNIDIWQGANLALAFLLELVAFTALGLLGARRGNGRARKLAYGVAAAVATMAVWGLFAAPQATFTIPAMAVLAKVSVFGGASVALHRLGHPRAAAIFPLLVLANLAIIHFS